jgi:hypothetical protein
MILRQFRKKICTAGKKNQGCSEDFSKIAKIIWIFESTKN